MQKSGEQHTTVNVDIGSRHKCRLIGGKKNREIGNVLGRAFTLDRACICDVSSDFGLRENIMKVCIDHAGA